MPIVILSKLVLFCTDLRIIAQITVDDVHIYKAIRITVRYQHTFREYQYPLASRLISRASILYKLSIGLRAMVN